MFVILLFSAPVLGSQWSDYLNAIGDRPWDDVENARWLSENHATGPVLGTNLFLGDFISQPYIYLDSLHVIYDSDAYRRKVLETICETRPNYLIANRISSYSKPTPLELLSAPNRFFPYLRPIHNDGFSFVFKIDSESFPWGDCQKN